MFRYNPNFADRILNMDSASRRGLAITFGKREWADLTDKIESSQKFVFTKAAWARVRDAMNATPEQLVHNAKFARPPHEVTWLEMDRPTFSPGGNNLADGHSGYLIVDGTVYSFLGNAHEELILVQPWAIDLNSPPTPHEQQTFMSEMGYTPEGLDRACWGAKLYPSIPDNLKAVLRNQHRLRLLPKAAREPEAWDKGRDLYDMQIRTVIASFLALNQPRSVLDVVAKDTQRRLSESGPQRISAHNVVTIKLGESDRVRLDYDRLGGGHATPGWHPVRGHYMTNRVARESNCTHGFGEPIDWWVATEREDGKQSWVCLGCGGKRAWRTYPNGRGDPTKGVITHHHLVD